MKVTPGSNVGEVFANGLRKGFDRMTGKDQNGGQDATMTDESAPVQRTEATNVNHSTVADTAGTVADSLYS